MTLSLIKPSGWAFGEILTSAQMEALDASQAQAIDGTGGGIYTPAAQIQILGAGLKVSSLTVTGTLSLLGNTTIGNSPTDALSVLATSTFSAPVLFRDPAEFEDVTTFDSDISVAGTLTASADVTIGDGPTRTLTVGATSAFNAPVTANDSFEFWDNVSVHSGAFFHALGDARLGSSASNDLQLLGALSNVLNLTGPGRVPGSWGGTLPAAGHDVFAADGQFFQTSSDIVGGTFQYRLQTSGAVPGDYMFFFTGRNLSPSVNITIVSNITSQNCIFAQGEFSWAVFVFFGGSWWCVATNT